MNSGPSASAAATSTMPAGKSPLVICLAALGFLCLPVLWAYLGGLWTREYYQFFPFSFAIVLYFAISRSTWKPDFNLSRVRIIVHAAVGLLAILLAGAGAFRGSPLASYGAFVLGLAILLDYWRERETSRRLIYLILPLLLTVRPPLDGDLVVITRLQLVTSRLASSFLNALQIDHIRTGNVLQPMRGAALEVAEACSGVQSLFTVMFIAAAIAAAKQYTVLRATILIGTGVFWALLMNTCRVLAIAVGQVWWDLNLLSGWRHDAIGYAAMLLAIPFLMSTDQFVQFLFGGIADDPRKYNRVNVVVLAWNWLFSGAVPSDGSEQSGRTESDWSAQSTWQKSARVIMAVVFGILMLSAWFRPGFLRAIQPLPGAIHSPEVLWVMEVLP